MSKLKTPTIKISFIFVSCARPIDVSMDARVDAGEFGVCKMHQ